MLVDNEAKLDGKIFIAMPCKSSVPIDVFTSYLALAKPSHVFYSTNIVPLDEARNTIVKVFLVNHPDCTHILWWDSDIIPPPDALQKLWSHQVEVASGLYFQTYPPFMPVWGMYVNTGVDEGFIPLVEWDEGKAIRVDGIGMGFCLVRRDVYQRMSTPWYKFDKFSEDYMFCLKLANELGIKPLVDTSVICKHISNRLPIDDKYFKMYQQKIIAQTMEIDIK